MEEETRIKVRDTRLTTGNVAAAAERNRRNVEATKESKDEGQFAEDEGRFPDNAPRHSDGEELSPLLADNEEQDFRSRWNSIQTGFVDEPHKAVEDADELVAQIMQRLAQSFSDQRSNLEKQWEKSEKISTEELRVALRRYRSFFDRLLSI